MIGARCAILFLMAVAAGLPTRVTPRDLVWAAAPPPFPAGVQIVVLDGKPGESVPYALRLRLPAGAKLTKATRARSAGVTVLSGSVSVESDVFPAGSYFIITPFADDLVATEESIVQVSGEGPWLKDALDVVPGVEVTVPSRADDAELQIIETSPQSYSDVTAETTIRVRVRYTVKAYQPGTFYLSPMFQSTRPGTTVSAPTMSQSMARPYPLTSASGEMTINVPVSGLLASTTVSRPLHMWIFLLRRTGDRTSRPLVRTSTLVFGVK